MTLQAFFDKYGGHGVDWDGVYGFQCVDLIDQYLKDVIGINPPWVIGAKDFWNLNLGWCSKIANTPTNAPQRGDIIVWNNFGSYGHIAICVTADVNTITSLDQNWPYGLTNNPNPSKVCQHNYDHVLGWFRPNMCLDLPGDWNSEDYLNANPDVRNAGVNPISHYMHYGFRENRLLHPLPPPPPPPVVIPPVVVEPPIIVTPPVDEPIPIEEPKIEDEPRPKDSEIYKKISLWELIIKILKSLNNMFKKG